ncbi:MAG: helix-turn-helix transcriptional regulator [Deltaproteobacteria bacterium]|nr:helix-turn-helix transcriptional regulator [Deltaproteobacteria bacterium]
MRPIDIVLEKLDMSKSELAREMKVSPATVTRWVKGNGFIPQARHRALMQLSKERRWHTTRARLTWEDLAAR